MLIAGCAGSPQPSPPGPSVGQTPESPARDGAETRREIVFSADGLEFDAVIDVPRAVHANGWGVLLIGGGVGNDLDWSTPGSLDMGGQQMRVTITGEDHADAPSLSAALTTRGFAVLRWSTIARGDPLADEWPVRATPRTPAELLSQARSALAALRNSGLAEHDRIVVVGHSLGAARACTLASEDTGIRALVLLSPAYFVRTDATPRTFAASGMKHGADVLRERPIPCLMLLGSLDKSQAVNVGGLLPQVRALDLPSLEVRLVEGLGHQLGPEQDGRLGPIDPALLAEVADWAQAALHQR